MWHYTLTPHSRHLWRWIRSCNFVICLACAAICVRGFFYGCVDESGHIVWWYNCTFADRAIRLLTIYVKCNLIWLILIMNTNQIAEIINCLFTITTCWFSYCFNYSNWIIVAELFINCIKKRCHTILPDRSAVLSLNNENGFYFKGDPTTFGNLKPAREVIAAVQESIESQLYNGYAPSTGEWQQKAYTLLSRMGSFTILILMLQPK